jgi:hypothetical protein
MYFKLNDYSRHRLIFIEEKTSYDAERPVFKVTTTTSSSSRVKVQDRSEKQVAEIM